VLRLQHTVYMYIAIMFVPQQQTNSSVPFSNFDLRVASINVNGINTDVAKRRVKLAKIARFVRDERINVLTIQEHHQYAENSHLVSDVDWLWFRSDFTSGSKGVAVGIRRDCLAVGCDPFIVYQDTGGRVIFVQLTDVHDNVVIVGALYFPADASASSRVDFLRSLPRDVVQRTLLASTQT
jgi:exonuclease III